MYIYIYIYICIYIPQSLCGDIPAMVDLWGSSCIVSVRINRVLNKHKARSIIHTFDFYFIFTFILTKLEFGFYRSHIYGLFKPLKNTSPNKYN